MALASLSLRQELRPLYIGGRPIPPVAALAAYFDESRRLDRQPGDNRPRIIAIAGYLSPVSLWDESLAPKWAKVLADAPHKIREFKAADCRHGTGEFASPWTSDERRELTTALVSILTDPEEALIGVGGATLLDFDRVPEDDHENLAAFGWLWAFMIVVGTLMKAVSSQEHYPTSIQPVFDEEDDLEDRAHKSFRKAREFFGASLGPRIKSPLFRPSHEIEALQAADLLAYETYKELENRLETPPRKPSIALERLVAGQPHIARYYDAHVIRELEGDPQAKYEAGLIYDSITGPGIVRGPHPWDSK